MRQMHRRSCSLYSLSCCALAAIAGLSARSQGQTATTITYQAQLKQLGVAVNSTADLQFSLWDALSGGSQVGSTQNLAGVTVSGGLFTVGVDFGAVAFNGNPRYLQIAVRSPAGAGAYTTLTTRQFIAPAPTALSIRLPLFETVSSASPGMEIQNSGTGGAMKATHPTSGNYGLLGTPMRGVTGLSTTANGLGVYGSASGASGIGVYADCGTLNGIALKGFNSVSQNYGYMGTSDVGVGGLAEGLTSTGVIGQHVQSGNLGRVATNDVGVGGVAANATSTGVIGTHIPTGNLGRLGTADYGVTGRAGASGIGVYGVGIAGGTGIRGYGESTGTAIIGAHLSGPYGYVGGTTVGASGIHQSGNYGQLGTSAHGVVGQGNLFGGQFHGTQVNSEGVRATVSGGLMGVLADGTRAAAVYGESFDGQGVRALSSTGTGVYTTAGTGGNALIADFFGSGNSTTSTNNCAIFRVSQFSPANVARIDRTGRGYFNNGTQTGGADVAEAMEVEGKAADYEPGDVLAISTTRSRTVTRIAEPYSTLVAGVHATKPGVLLSNRHIDEPLDDTVPMGIVGIIPTKVSAENGPIRRGDLLVSASTSGHAMKGTDRSRMVGAIIGKALDDFDGSGTGMIEVMVNVK